jgi:cytochrome c-type biogenesis protein
MEPSVALAAAFVAGLLSFFSPYVLPIIPGYLSYISGLSVDEMRGSGGNAGAGGVAVASPREARRRVLAAAIAFCTGFSTMFVLMGACAGAVGQTLVDQRVLLQRVGGAIVILFGLHVVGVLRAASLRRVRRMHPKRKPPGAAGALLVGAAFAVGWTPCFGPILAGIVAIAVTHDTVTEGARLLGCFSLGLAVPFVATSLALNHYFAASARLRAHSRTIEIVSGAFLIVIGVMMILRSRGLVTYT